MASDTKREDVRVATFSVDGVEYELVSLDSIHDFTLGDLRVLEEEGGLKLSDLVDGDVGITTRLILALVLLSMRRVNPAASLADAEKVSIGVLESLAGDVATDEADVEADAVPPSTVAVADGAQP